MEKKELGNPLRPKIEWSLNDEGMGPLERAGLAGLYLTLTAAEQWADQGDRQAQELRQLIKWELSDQTIRLWWEGEDKEILKKLMKWAWQEKEGVFFLPAIHRTQDEREHIYKRLDVHMGLLQTFYQHRKVLPLENQNITQNIQLDENRFFQIKYQKIKTKNKDLPPTKNLDKLLKKGLDANVISLPFSWIYPGAAKRFGRAAVEEENWSGPPKLGILLLYAPLACIFLEMPKTKVKAKAGSQFQPNWAFLVPEIKNLISLGDYFPLFRSQTPADFLQVRVQSLGDAALRFASAYAARGIQKRLGLIRVYLAVLGQVSHYQGQKVRKKILEFTPTEISISRYQCLMRHLGNEFRLRKLDKSGDPAQAQTPLRIRQPTARGRIADNLVQGKPWYSDLMWPHPWLLDRLENQREREKQQNQENLSLEHLWFNNLLADRRALMNLAEEEKMWDSPEERAILTIFHQTLHQLLNKEEEAQKRGGSRTLRERWEDRVQALRRGLMRAKTLELNRKFLMEFLAEGGGSKELTEKKEALWRFLNHPYDWQKARDLALLALVTFKDKRLGKPAEIQEPEEETANE